MVWETAFALDGRWEKASKAPWGTAYPAAALFEGDMLVMERETDRPLLYDPKTNATTP